MFRVGRFMEQAVYAAIMLALVSSPVIGGDASGRKPAAKPLAATPAPVTFARGGRQVEVRLLFVLGELGIGGTGVFKKEVTLTAFGRTWSEPADVTQTSAASRATITVPGVRVPTVFSVVDRRRRAVGELVAYPDRDVTWDKKITLYSCGAPAWFDQWASAVGLPVKKFPVADLPLVPRRILADKKARRLLILGTTSKDFSANTKINLLVLHAGWFGKAGGPVRIAPGQMQGGLAGLAGQKWAKPPRFASHRRPYTGLKNRWAWITGEAGSPLVEEIRPLAASRKERRLFPRATGKPDVLDRKPKPVGIARLVASYLPWQEQLGRNEYADAAFLALLRAAGNAAPRECRWSPVEIVYPKPADIDRATRPVLRAVRTGRFWRRKGAADAQPEYVAPINIILDLRGTGAARDKRFGNGAKWLNPGARQPRTRLVILGDDKVLDQWPWLKMDRSKKQVNTPGVLWLADDELPPSEQNQIKLMLALTQAGVPLAP